jgi:outer membrane protein assembly factor BamB
MAFSRLLPSAVLMLMPWLLPRLAAQTDGARKWTFSTAASSLVAGNIVSSPSIAPDGTIYIGTEVGASTATNPAGRIVAMTPGGALKWTFLTAEWIDSTPAVGRDGTIYFGCWDGFLYALDASGNLKWKRDLGAFISASPAIGADDTIYIGTGAGNLYAFSPDGTQKWLFPTLYWIEATPAIAPDGTIYVGSDDNTFYAVNPDGTEKWHYICGNDIASSAAIGGDGSVYVGCRDLNLYAFTAAGALKWTFLTTDMIDASPVLGADGTVYAANTGGRVFALTPDGTQKWQYPAAAQPALGSIYSTPAIRSDGSLVFGSSDNAVYALRADGTLLWKSAVGDFADSSPAIGTDGTIYIGCSDKNVYAFTGSVAQSMTDWPQLGRNPRRTGYQPFGAAAGTTGRLANLSVRTFAGSAEKTLIVGFVINNATRNLLVRGVGPTLTSYGVSGVLSDPTISLSRQDTGATIGQNDNWSVPNGAAITAAGNALGAFPLPSGSLDAALLSDFAPGAQTMKVTGTNGVTGIALAEIYDNGGPDNARLSNVSARSFVDIGGGVLIAGFVVRDSTRAVLIRAVGPTLANYGVTGSLARPQLRVFTTLLSQQVVVADNGGWSTGTQAGVLAATAPRVYAFPLGDGSSDSAMLLTLPPGSYTAQVSGVNSTTGVALVEVYEVP